MKKRIDETERRTKMIAAFVTPREWLEARKAADKLHLPLSNFLRMKIFATLAGWEDVK